MNSSPCHKRHPLNISRACWLIVLLFPLAISQAVSADDAESKKPDDLYFEVWGIPASTMTASDPAEKSGKRTPKPGLKSREGSKQFDATDFVRALGIADVPGAEAIYDVSGSSLIVKNTKANIETIDYALSFSGIAGAPIQITTEVSIFECKLPPKPHQGVFVWPSYSDLTNLPAKDIRLLDRISGVSKSAERVAFSKLITSAQPKETPSSGADSSSPGTIGATEPGIKVECESVAGPDSTIDTDISFRWRGKTSDGEWQEISFNSMLSSWDGYPVVLHVSKAGNQPGKYLVVTILLRLATAADWSIESLSAMAKRAREFQKEISSSLRE